MPIATSPAFCFIEHLNGFKHNLFVTSNDHLGNTLTIFHNEVLLRKIYEHNAHLTAIVSIHRAWGIKHCDPLF